MDLLRGPPAVVGGKSIKRELLDSRVSGQPQQLQPRLQAVCVAVLLGQPGPPGPAPVSVRDNSDVLWNPHRITFLPARIFFCPQNYAEA